MEKKWRTFHRTQRITVFFVNEGNSYELIDTQGATSILIPGDVVVDFPQLRRTMRVIDFMQMVEAEGWTWNDNMPVPGPCQLWLRAQTRRIAPAGRGLDPDVVELEVEGNLVMTEDGSTVRGFALRGILAELKTDGFVEMGSVQ